jgi:hypothetical protein
MENNLTAFYDCEARECSLLAKKWDTCADQPTLSDGLKQKCRQRAKEWRDKAIEALELAKVASGLS